MSGGYVAKLDAFAPDSKTRMRWTITMIVNDWTITLRGPWRLTRAEAEADSECCDALLAKISSGLTG